MKSIFIIFLSLFLIKTAVAQQLLPGSAINVQNQQHPFKVTQLLFDVADNHLLEILKNNQSNSLISVGKMVSANTFREERSRIFKLLAPAQLQLKMNDIVFMVDTTIKKGSCKIVLFVKSDV